MQCERNDIVSGEIFFLTNVKVLLQVIGELGSVPAEGKQVEKKN